MKLLFVFFPKHKNGKCVLLCGLLLSRWHADVFPERLHESDWKLRRAPGAKTLRHLVNSCEIRRLCTPWEKRRGRRKRKQREGREGGDGLDGAKVGWGMLLWPANSCLASVLPAMLSLTLIDPQATMCCHTDTDIHPESDTRHPASILLLLIKDIFTSRAQNPTKSWACFQYVCAPHATQSVPVCPQVSSTSENNSVL